MSRVDKFSITVLIFVATVSFFIYGGWEDKITFISLLLPLLNVALAIWAVTIFCNRGKNVMSGMKKAPVSHATQDSLPPYGVQSTSSDASSSRFWIPNLQVPPGGLLLFLFWLYGALITPFSIIPYEAKISTLRLGVYVGTYWAAANICSRFPSRKTVWTVLFLALLAVALYSLGQHKMAPSQLFGMERYTNYWEGNRLGGTYQCPNHIAHLFQMWFPFCLVFLFIPQFGWFWRICFAYVIPVCCLLIYQTQSRAGILGTIAGVGTLFLLVMLRKNRRIFLIALIAAPLLMAGGLGVLWTGSAMFQKRMQPVVTVTSSALSGDWDTVATADFRPMTWFDSLVMIKDRPWFGVGPGNYGQTFPEYRTRLQATRIETVHPHNEPIELITEYGIVGTLLFSGALICFCISLIRLVKRSDKLYHALPAAAMLSALAGTLVHGFFDFELRIFPNAFMFSILGGCAVAPVLKAGSVSSQSRWNTFLSLVDTPGKILFVIAVTLSAVWSFQVMSSAGLRAWGDRLRLAGDRTKAMPMYNAAVAIDPQNWQAYLGLGQVFSHQRYYELDAEKKSDLAERERDAFVQAYRHNTKKEEVVYGLGRAELALGWREEGLNHLRQAAHYKRFNDFYWRKLGIELRKDGVYEDALETFLYAQKLDQSNQTVRHNIKWLRGRMGLHE